MATKYRRIRYILYNCKINLHLLFLDPNLSKFVGEKLFKSFWLKWSFIKPVPGVHLIVFHILPKKIGQTFILKQWIRKIPFKNC
jgi:hypothetical protein